MPSLLDQAGLTVWSRLVTKQSKRAQMNQKHNHARKYNEESAETHWHRAGDNKSQAEWWP